MAKMDSTTDELNVPTQATPTYRAELLVHAWLLFVCSSIIGMSFLMSSQGSKDVILPGMVSPLPDVCMSRRMVGLDCPGCGMTRSFINISSGNLSRAFAFHPLGIVIYAIVAFQIPFRLTQIARIFSGRAPLLLPHWEKLLWVLAAAMLLFWVFRLVGQLFY
jgi:hypothetical protein